MCIFKKMVRGCNRTPQEEAIRVSAVTLVINLLLAAGKLVAGLVAHSGAMVSDAVHSASDVFSTIIVMIGVQVSGEEVDLEHPYGHERLECIAALILGAVLGLTGCAIGLDGIRKTMLGFSGELAPPGALALWAAAASIAVKEWMYWYTRGTALRVQSSAMLADAWHHRSDALSSVGSLVGIGGAMLGWPVFDPLASLCISVIIIKVAYDILLDAVSKLTDRACADCIIEEIRCLTLSQPGVCSIDMLKTRMFSNKFYIDMEISVDATLTLAQAHTIAQNVHDAIEHALPSAKHCMVHINPCELCCCQGLYED